MKTILLKNMNGYYDIRRFVKSELSNIILDIEKPKESYYNRVYPVYIDTIFISKFTFNEYIKDIFYITRFCDKNLYLRDIDNFHIQLLSNGKIIETVRIIDCTKLSFKDFLKNSF